MVDRNRPSNWTINLLQVSWYSEHKTVPFLFKMVRILLASQWGCPFCFKESSAWSDRIDCLIFHCNMWSLVGPTLDYRLSLDNPVRPSLPELFSAIVLKTYWKKRFTFKPVWQISEQSQSHCDFLWGPFCWSQQLLMGFLMCFFFSLNLIASGGRSFIHSLGHRICRPNLILLLAFLFFGTQNLI